MRKLLAKLINLLGHCCKSQVEMEVLWSVLLRMMAMIMMMGMPTHQEMEYLLISPSGGQTNQSLALEH